MSNKHWCLPNYPLVKKYSRMLGTSHFFNKDKPIHESLCDVAKYMTSIKKIDGVEEAVYSGTFATLGIEYDLSVNNSPCLFVESKSLAIFLVESTYSLGIAKMALSQSSLKWICFPSVCFRGINFKPCAIGKSIFSNLDRSRKRPLYDYFFYLRIDDDHAPFFGFNEECADDVLSDPNYRIFFYRKEDTAITKAQHDLMLFMFRAALGALVYASAFPDYIRDGLPDDVKSPDLHKPRILRAAPAILEGATRTSISMHIRAGHFRCLRDERYKHNEDGTAKIIFVRQSVVAGKLTPKTAVGL